MEQLPRAIDYQKLLFHEKAVGANGLSAARAHEFGEGGQQMHEEYDQILHEKREWGRPLSDARSIKRLFLREK